MVADDGVPARARRALEGDAELVCQMDADLSHDPQYLPSMVAATAAHDLVIGSRYLNGVSVVNWLLRRLAIILVERRKGASKLSSGTLLEPALIPWRLQLRSVRRGGRRLP